MKFNGWMITGLISVGAFGATALGATPVSDDHELTEALRTLQTSAQSTTSAWPELEKFQTSLWKSMALDPGPITIVPVKQVPQELFAEDLTTNLSTQLEAIKQSNLPKIAHAQAEYEQYITTVRKIIAHRISRQFPQARAYAKRGTLDEQYSKLMKRIQASAGSSATQEEAIRTIEHFIQSTKEASKAPAVEAKKNPFTNGNQFIWATLIALIGFAFGLTAIKMNPEFFERFIHAKVTATFTDSTAPAATHTHQLNYARWLREFEELLAKLKATQLTHERRIEEVYKHSEKLNQFATALCSDPRIKNEANLEFRMSNLLRELHQQLEQTNELKTGDRAQIHVTLEHCLKLCDAIESNGVEYHPQHAGRPPQNNPNARAS